MPVVHIIFSRFNYIHGYFLDYLKQQGGQLAEYEVSRIVFQITEGLIFFQKNNLVHRDFKLQNILLDKNRNIKITDFGLATELTHR
jgi:serine/threonine protein kinase